MTEDSDLLFDDDGNLRCKGTKDNGDPCTAPSSLVDKETGYCWAHDPSKEQERKDRQSRGGKRGGPGALRPSLTAAEIRDDLGPLETYEDAKRWLVLMGRKSAAGEIHPKLALRVKQYIQEWRKVMEREQVAKAKEIAEKAQEEAKGAFGPRLVEQEEA